MDRLVNNRLLSLLCIALIAGCSTPKKETAPLAYRPNLEHGSKVFIGLCSSCHDKGEQSAPSLRDPEEWDLQKLSRPGIVRQHMNMSYLSRARSLSEADERDALFFIQSTLNDRDKEY